LGFKEKLPKNYKELLNDTDFLSYTIARIEDNIAKLKQKLKEEKNEYKKKQTKKQINKIKKRTKNITKSRLTFHVSRLTFRKWKEQDSYPTTCQPTEGTGEGSAYR